MKKIRLKHIAVILISVCFLIITSVFIYSKIKPAEAKIDHVFVSSMDERFLNNYLKQAKNSIDNLQVFCDMDHIPSENASDYIQVLYACDFKINNLLGASEIRSIVESVPENDTSYILTIPPDYLATSNPFKNQTIFCNVLICIKGLSEEDIEEKIRAIDISIIYKENNEPKKIKVEGIESLESEDIKYNLQMF